MTAFMLCDSRTTQETHLRNRLQTQLISMYLAVSLVPSTAFAANGEQASNIFKADLSNPDIAATVTEFESVCLPFITHATELSPEQDRAVFNSLMTEKGYDFDSVREWKKFEQLEDFNWVRSSCAPTQIHQPVQDGNYTIFPGRDGKMDEVQDYSRNQYVVSPGVANQVVTSTVTTVGPICEVLAVSMGSSRRLNHVQNQYRKSDDYPLSAYLTWRDSSLDYIENLSFAHARRFGGLPITPIRLRTIFPPASTCQINSKTTELSADILKDMMISKDSDWTKTDITDRKTKQVVKDTDVWQQCTTQDNEHYIYTVSLKDSSLSMKVEVLQEEKSAHLYNCK